MRSKMVTWIKWNKLRSIKKILELVKIIVVTQLIIQARLNWTVFFNYSLSKLCLIISFELFFQFKFSSEIVEENLLKFFDLKLNRKPDIVLS